MCPPAHVSYDFGVKKYTPMRGMYNQFIKYVMWQYNRYYNCNKCGNILEKS